MVNPLSPSLARWPITQDERLSNVCLCDDTIHLAKIEFDGRYSHRFDFPFLLRVNSMGHANLDDEAPPIYAEQHVGDDVPELSLQDHLIGPDSPPWEQRSAWESFANCPVAEMLGR